MSGARRPHLQLSALPIIALAVMAPSFAHAQWWTAAPADFEDCAERIERSRLSGDAKSSAIMDCESKFAGRRKRGGGYTYYDFMQNRSFDIAGPNPTAAEQKIIDQQYASYLDSQRRGIILAAFAKKQNEQPQSAIDTDFRDSTAAPATTPSVALPRPRPKLRAAKGPDCSTEPLACGWSKLSTGLKDIKDALFGPSTPSKAKRTG